MAGGTASGILFFVVGPSGAGKDTLIDGARAALRNDDRFSFATRLITRPADAGGEAHEAIDAEGFAALEQRRRAAGLLAGPWPQLRPARQPCATTLAAGRHVIANGSRAVLARLVGQVPRLIALVVTASPEILAQRLAARGRETAAGHRRAAGAQPAAAAGGRRDASPSAMTARARRASPRLLRGARRGDAAAVVEAAADRRLARPDRLSARRTASSAPQDYDGPGKVEIAAQGRAIRARVNLVDAGTLLAPHELGLSREAFSALGLAAGAARSR